MSELKHINLDKIIISNDQPRKEFPRNFLQELATSIKMNGLKQAILVRPKGEMFELVFGERRFKAHKLLKMKTIKAEVEKLTDEQVKIVRLIENLQREKVHPLDEARSILELLDDPKQSIETIAGILGKEKSYIAQRIQLNKLIKEAYKAFAEGKIELGHALLICKLPETEQRRIWKYVEQQFRVPTVSELKNHIAGSFMPNLSLAPFNRNNKLLLTSAGSCNDCPKRTGNAEDLFSDFSGKNLCADLSCYKKKINLHIALELDLAESAGTPLVKLSNSYETKKDVLGFRDFGITMKAAGKNVVKAIYTAGPEKGKIINVVLKAEEKMEGSKDASANSAKIKEPTEEEKLAKLNEKIKEQREAAFRNALGTALLELSADGIILIPFLKQIYITIEDIFYYDNTITDVDEIKKMDDISFINLFNKSVIKKAINDYEFYDDDFLLETARRFEIDEKAIRKTVEENLPLLKKLPEEKKGEVKDAK